MRLFQVGDIIINLDFVTDARWMVEPNGAVNLRLHFASPAARAEPSYSTCRSMSFPKGPHSDRLWEYLVIRCIQKD